MKYQPPFLPGMITPVEGIHNSDPNASYQNGDPATGQAGSIVPAEALEHVMREIVHVITWSGQTPNHLDLEQLRKALKTYVEASVASNAGGTPVYEGLTSEDKPKHKIRPLIEGDNITLTLVENPPSSGRYGVRISAAAAPGGGDDVPLLNVGDGANVFKGFFDDYDQLRSIKGINGIVTQVNGDVIEVDGSGIGGATLATLAPMLIAQQQRAGNASAQSLPSNVWTKRLINTEIVNQIPTATFDGGNGQISLPAGTYRVNFGGVAGNSGNHRARVQDVTHGVTLAQGLTNDSNPGGDNGLCGSSQGEGRFVLDEAAVIELQHRGTPGGSLTQRMGDPTNVHPEIHVDGYISITKEA